MEPDSVTRKQVLPRVSLEFERLSSLAVYFVSQDL